MKDLATFPETARVWIYQADKPVPADLNGHAQENIRQFAKDWTSHNAMLTATGDLVHQRFIVLVVNEQQAGVSGCSIDASVQFVRALGSQYGIDFLDRLNFAYLNADQEVCTAHKDELTALHRDGIITDETLFFNNLIKTKEEFDKQWLVPLGQSWMKRFV